MEFPLATGCLLGKFGVMPPKNKRQLNEGKVLIEKPVLRNIRIFPGKWEGAGLLGAYFGHSAARSSMERTQMQPHKGR